MGLASRWKHGGVEYPLTEATDNTLLRDADPGLYYALQLFESALDTYVKPRLLTQALLEGFRFPSAVEKTIPFEPTPFLLSEHLSFPIFCLYRSEEDWDTPTKAFLGDESLWEWAYVLPPLTPRQIEKLHPILRSVSVVISTFASQSFDPEWEGGSTLRDLSGIQKMKPGRVKYGAFEHIQENDRWWRAVTGQLKVQERSAIVAEAFPRFTGSSIQMDVTAPDGTTVEDLFTVSTPTDLEIGEVSPASGTKAGGTPLTIDAPTPCFRPGGQYHVLVGGAYASNVVAVHPHRLVCVTPEHEAFPTYAADVQVIGPGGQLSNVLEGAFTFTTP